MIFSLSYWGGSFLTKIKKYFNNQFDHIELQQLQTMLFCMQKSPNSPSQLTVQSIFSQLTNSFDSGLGPVVWI